MPNLRLSSKSFFLTYSQCDLTKEDLLQHLVAHLHEYGPTLRVGHELHQDGGHHLHAYIRLERKLERADGSRFFDHRGHHPNITSTRSHAQVITYVSKDGDFVDYGDVGDGPGSAKNSWAQIAASVDRQQFLAAVKKDFPRDYILSYDRLLSYASAVYKPTETAYIPRERDEFDTSLYADMQNWIDQGIDFQVYIAFLQAKACLLPPQPPTSGGSINMLSKSRFILT